jgi:hypothetical protein
VCVDTMFPEVTVTEVLHEEVRVTCDAAPSKKLKSFHVRTKHTFKHLLAAASRCCCCCLPLPSSCRCTHFLLSLYSLPPVPSALPRRCCCC